MWLLMLSIPLQGLAASTMHLCAAHHGSASAAAPGATVGPMHGAGMAAHALHAAPAVSHDVHDAHGADDQHGGHDGAVAAAADHGHAHAKGVASGHGVLKCSGVGCAVTALPAAMPRIPSIVGAALPQPATVLLPPGVVPDGLEQPPRA